MIFLLTMVIFHCYVSLSKGKSWLKLWKQKIISIFGPNIPLEHTPGIPKHPNGKNSFVNCWLRVWDHAGKFLDSVNFFADIVFTVFPLGGGSIIYPLCSNPSCKWFWRGCWVSKHLLTGYLER